jgi:4-hydroxy-tetrahydrodipicolinate reductase
MKIWNLILCGCGVMGCKTAEALLEKHSYHIVGAVDINSDFIGKDLGDLFENSHQTGIIIREKLEELLDSVEADAVILTTTSHLKNNKPLIEACLEAGLNVVSTCEELIYPWIRHPEIASGIDQKAKVKGVTVVGTGINPGFLMDTLPAILTGPCLSVDSIKVTRMMDSFRRRVPFQRKVGTALSRAEFRRQIENGVITGHVGLLESIHMIAAAVDWKLDELVELPPEPVLAETKTETALGVVPAGDVIGLSSVAFAKRDGREVIRLEFVANASVKNEYDEIIIEGRPRIHQRILGGVHGDLGTVAMTINTISRAVEGPPGLKTMLELPPAVYVP